MSTRPCPRPPTASSDRPPTRPARSRCHCGPARREAPDRPGRSAATARGASNPAGRHGATTTRPALNTSPQAMRHTSTHPHSHTTTRTPAHTCICTCNSIASATESSHPRAFAHFRSRNPARRAHGGRRYAAHGAATPRRRCHLAPPGVNPWTPNVPGRSRLTPLLPGRASLVHLRPQYVAEPPLKVPLQVPLGRPALLPHCRPRPTP